VEMHRDAVKRIHPSCPDYLRAAAQRCGDEAVELGRRYGYRNSQVTVLAPTGTIAFMMDCDTTGVEPDIALVKYKLLAGGGMLKIVNRTVPMALSRLGYSDAQVAEMIKYIDENDTIEGAPHIQDNHLAVFDCAFRPAKGKRSIHHFAHLKMMAAAQPFLSGAISKTVNMPQESTVEEIMQTYLEGWRLGLKAIAIYRDGSKQSQPLNTSKNSSAQIAKAEAEAAKHEAEELATRVLELEGEIKELRTRVDAPTRHRLPDTRQALTHKFDIAGHEGYITVGLYESGMPGELFIQMSKEGSTIGGLMDGIGTLTSLALQYGVPLDALVRKFAHVRFEPSGFTKNAEIRNAASIIDYVFRWMGIQFIPDYRKSANPQTRQAELAIPGLQEEIKKQVNRPVPELEVTGDTDFVDVQSRPRPNANGNGNGKSNGHRPRTEPAEPRAVKTLNDSVAHFQQDAPTCPNCGHVAVRNGACYKCFNCGDSLGCS